MANKILSVVILILIGIAAYLWFTPPKIPAGKVLVTQAYLDSLAAIANQPPEIIEDTDTVWPKPDEVYIEKNPPTPTDQGQHYAYADSLISPEVSVWVWDKISKYGIVEERKWAYRLHVPFSITKQRTIYQPVPKPYPIYVERNYQQNPKIRYYGMVGFGTQFTVDGGIFYNDKFMVGAQGGKDLAVVKLGLVF